MAFAVAPATLVSILPGLVCPPNLASLRAGARGPTLTLTSQMGRITIAIPSVFVVIATRRRKDLTTLTVSVRGQQLALVPVRDADVLVTPVVVLPSPIRPPLLPRVVRLRGARLPLTATGLRVREECEGARGASMEPRTSLARAEEGGGPVTAVGIVSPP